MSLGMHIWSEITPERKWFSQTIFAGWKTLLSSIFYRKIRKILWAIFEEILKNLIFGHFFLILINSRFFEKFGLGHFLSQIVLQIHE